jgi:glutamate-1-semialdehyde 2,1-aminomutase
MAWASFTNSGNNAIDAAVALARLHSGRSLILIPENSYQHEYSFCLDTQKGLLWGGERLLTFPYGNEQILEELFRRHRGKIAGVLLPPYFQPGTDHSSMPHGTWYTKVEQLCHQEGALFIMDDLRTTMRMSLHGSHAYFGAQPDLICLGEALANGRPIGALLGVRQLRDSANTLPASFSYGISPASITAAEQTMEFLTKENHMEQLQMKGQTFRRGLQETATQAGLPLNITGPPAIPSIRLAGDPGGKFSGVVSAQLIAHGVYLDLTRGIYLSLGHSEADIQLTMERAARGFSAAKKILAN